MSTWIQKKAKRKAHQKPDSYSAHTIAEHRPKEPKSKFSFVRDVGAKSDPNIASMEYELTVSWAIPEEIIVASPANFEERFTEVATLVSKECGAGFIDVNSRYEYNEHGISVVISLTAHRLSAEMCNNMISKFRWFTNQLRAELPKGYTLEDPWVDKRLARRGY